MKKFNTIWLIDDDEIFRFTAVQLMKRINFANQVFCFENGAEAVQAVDKLIQNQIQMPDVVFLDVNMPVLDGWQFLDELVKMDLPFSLRVYMLSSSSDIADLSSVSRYSIVQKYFIKPITLDLLAEVS